MSRPFRMTERVDPVVGEDDVSRPQLEDSSLSQSLFESVHERDLGQEKPSQPERDIQKVDIVNIFRPSQDVLPVVRHAIRKRLKVVWMQEGIYNKEAGDEARKHGIKAV